MPEPTKADLKAAVAKLTEEKAALFDILRAAREAVDKGKHPNYILGYIGQAGEHPEVPLSCLHAYAARLREVPADQLDPPVPACPSVAPHTGRACTEAGEHEFHRAGMVTWTDAPQAVTA